jgi:hypothetical protein
MRRAKRGIDAMLKTLINSLVIDAVRKRTGIPEPGVLTTAMLTTGASLLFSRGRRPVGLALIAVGGVLLWHEHVPETIDVKTPSLPPPEPASGAAA